MMHIHLVLVGYTYIELINAKMWNILIKCELPRISPSDRVNSHDVQSCAHQICLGMQYFPKWVANLGDPIAIVGHNSFDMGLG